MLEGKRIKLSRRVRMIRSVGSNHVPMFLNQPLKIDTVDSLNLIFATESPLRELQIS